MHEGKQFPTAVSQGVSLLLLDFPETSMCQLNLEESFPSCPS